MLRPLCIATLLILSSSQGRSLIAEGQLATVQVDAQLYRRPDRPGTFFVRFWVQNRSARPLGLDEGTLHVNQWVESSTPKRQAVDERSRPPEPLTTAKRAWLHRRMREGGVVLTPGSTLQMDRAFDGPGASDLAKGRSPYVIVTFDGSLYVTDGKQDEVLSAQAKGLTASDLSVPTPVQLSPLPAPPPK